MPVVPRCAAPRPACGADHDFQHDRFRLAAIESRRKLDRLLDNADTSNPEWFRLLSLKHCPKITPTSAEFWYGQEGGQMNYVRVVRRVPGTLGEDILRFRRDLPRDLYGCSVEIDGEEVRILAPEEVPAPWVDDWIDDEAEVPKNLDVELEQLPLIQVGDQHHFIKKSRHRIEVQNLMKCGGAPHIVQLLGKSPAGELVFPRERMPYFGNHDFRAVPLMKQVLIQVIDGLAFLHSVGIIHRDIQARNLLITDDHQIVICDLESTYDMDTNRAPELWGVPVNERMYTPACDVYSLGNLMWELTHNNCVRMITFHHAFLVPPPFDEVYFACLANDPGDRPTLDELRSRVLAIE